MLILGIDTSTSQVGVALGSDEGILGEVRLARGRRHAEALVPAIAYLLHESGSELSELAALAVGIGPGLFTGLRVGVTTAKVMAQALRIPVVPVASLDLLAYSVRLTDRSIAALLDARRGEVYSALYRSVPGGAQRISEYRVAPPSELEAELEAARDDLLLVGDGALLYRDRLQVERAEWASSTYARPSPAALVELASARYNREEFCRPHEVEPLYLRKSDAQIAWPESGSRTAPGSR